MNLPTRAGRTLVGARVRLREVLIPHGRWHDGLRTAMLEGELVAER